MHAFLGSLFLFIQEQSQPNDDEDDKFDAELNMKVGDDEDDTGAADVQHLDIDENFIDEQ